MDHDDPLFRRHALLTGEPIEFDDEASSDPILSRRALLTGAAGLAGAATLSGCSQLSELEGALGGRAKTELEIENENMVTQFCLDWDKMDAEYLGQYMADDIVYMMFPGRPDIVGKKEFIKTIKPFFKMMKRVEWKMLDSKVLGPLVVNERIDHFYAKDPKRSMHFGIAGIFVVEKGKIVHWRDYNMPGGIRKIGPLDSELS